MREAESVRVCACTRMRVGVGGRAHAHTRTLYSGSFGMSTWVLIVILLVSVGAGAQEHPKADQIYATRCAFCHGDKGKGDGIAGGGLKPPPTNFARAEYWKTVTDKQVRDAIAKGKPGTAMVPLGNSLRPGEIDALVDYLKKFAPQP